MADNLGFYYEPISMPKVDYLYGMPTNLPAAMTPYPQEGEGNILEDYIEDKVKDELFGPEELTAGAIGTMVAQGGTVGGTAATTGALAGLGQGATAGLAAGAVEGATTAIAGAELGTTAATGTAAATGAIEMAPIYVSEGTAGATGASSLASTSAATTGTTAGTTAGTATGIGAGTVATALAIPVAAGVISSQVRDHKDRKEMRRYKRRFYRMTPEEQVSFQKQSIIKEMTGRERSKKEVIWSQLPIEGFDANTFKSEIGYDSYATKLREKNIGFTDEDYLYGTNLFKRGGERARKQFTSIVSDEEYDDLLNQYL